MWHATRQPLLRAAISLAKPDAIATTAGACGDIAGGGDTGGEDDLDLLRDDDGNSNGGGEDGDAADGDAADGDKRMNGG
ncbi:hypothetical protein Tco_0136029 [Tanacetum coccineum]